MPEGWAWCRLKEVCTVFGRIGFRGYTRDDLVEKGNGAITLSPSNLINMKLDLTDCTYISWPKYEESPEIQLDINDIVVVKTGSSYGKTSLVDNLTEKTTLNPQLMVLKERKCNSKYLCYFLNTQYMRKNFEDLVNGTAIPTFSQEKFGMKLFPLPPASEQEKIVESIEESFSQIDILDNEKSDLQTAIKQTKSKILDLAIHGKLVPQDPNDEPAEELLKRIATSDNRPYEKFKESEELFEVPENWSLCYLKETCTDFIVPQRDKPKAFDGTIPWCRIEDIEGKYLNGSLSNQLVSKDTIKQMNMHICPVGSVICSCSASLGIQAITTIECCTNQTFIGIVPIESVLYNEYLFYYLKAQTKYFHEIATGTTIKYISRDKFEELPFALPPFEEQKRIVSKIENLFTVLDEIVLNLV